MTLTDWLDEYRALNPNSMSRPVAEPVDGWEEPDLLAPADRVRDMTPRWRERAASIGYGRLTAG